MLDRLGAASLGNAAPSTGCAAKQAQRLRALAHVLAAVLFPFAAFVRSCGRARCGAPP